MTTTPKRLKPTPELIDVVRQVYPSGAWMAVQAFFPELNHQQIKSLATARGIRLNAEGQRAATLRRVASTQQTRSLTEAAHIGQSAPAPRRYADWSQPDSPAVATAPRRYASIWHLAQELTA